MIDYLRGQIAFIGEDFIVVDVGGVGYRLFCANPLQFQSKMSDAGDVTIFVHYHVREDAHLLYGFSSREEQILFRRLLEVSGVGPKVAMGVLSGAEPQAVAAAIQREDIAFLTRLPGIGRKTAQRLILDLKDKLAAIDIWSVSGTAPLPDSDTPRALSSVPAVWAEAREALLALGYRDNELDHAWHVIKADVDEHATTDALMKQALKVLYSG